MSGQYPVTATVTPIFPSAQPDAQTVKNTGAVPVYVGNSSAISTGNGYALGPGSAITWESDNPLFAVCATGTNSTLTVLDNGGPLFDASAVAAQIKISGVPSIDAPTILFDETLTQSTHLAQSIDISQYQSVAILIFEKQTSGSNPATPGIGSTLYRDVLIDMTSKLLNPLGSPFKSYAGGYMGGGSVGTSNYPEFTATFPAMGDSLTVTVNGDDVGIAALSSRLVILGSYRNVPRGQFATQSTYATHDGFLSGRVERGNLKWSTSTLAPGQQVVSIPPTLSGDAKITVYNQAVASPGFNFYIQDMDSGAVLGYMLNPPAGLSTIDVNIPAGPITLIVNNLSSTATINAVIDVSFLYDLG